MPLMNEILVLRLASTRHWSDDQDELDSDDELISADLDIDESDIKYVSLDGYGQPLSMQAQSGWPNQETVTRAQKIIALVPGEAVLATETRLPKKRSRQILQAVPFAIEEQLIDRPEDVHVGVGAAPSSDDENQDTPLAVCRRDKMMGWLEQLKKNNIKAHEVRPEWDFDAINDVSDEDSDQAHWRCLLLNGRAVLSDDAGNTRFVCPAELAPDYLTAFVDSEQAIEVQPLVKNSDDPVIDAWQAASADIQWQEPERVGGDPWVYLARRVVAKQAPLNLLQGTFAPRREWLAHWQRWRAAAVLLVGLLAIWGVSGFLNHRDLKSQLTSLQAETNQVFETSFADLGPTADPVATARSWLSSQDSVSSNDSGVSVLTVLSALASASKDLPEIQTQSLSFNQGEADLKVTAPDSQQLEKFQSSMQSLTKFAVEIRGFNNLDKGIEAQLSLSPQTATEESA
ncbi:MAG: hypothetical protein HKM24_07360 [Gammaproteobacteria bacterium]|nr:hypothetical protein [Gammaproteobacteria bacterium]